MDSSNQKFCSAVIVVYAWETITAVDKVIALESDKQNIELMNKQSRIILRSCNWGTVAHCQDRYYYIGYYNHIYNNYIPYNTLYVVVSVQLPATKVRKGGISMASNPAI